MTAKKNSNPFGKFEGTSVGEAETAKWEFPGIGYNATKGIFYIDEDQVEEVTLSPLAIRQCKETTSDDGTVHRYNVKTPRNQMVNADDVTYRLQVACVVGGEIYAFGARSWTARASFLNPRGGQYRDAKFATGLWYQLEDYIKAMKQNHGVSTTPLCYELTLKPSDNVLTVGSGKNTSEATPIMATGNPEFVGPERVAAHGKIYQDEDLAGWVQEWNKHTAEKVEEVEEAAPAVEEELPDGFAF